MNSADTSRDTSGRFTPGHGGRPKGAKNKRKTFSATEFTASVTAAAADKLEALTGKALDVIEQRLDEGDQRTATWTPIISTGSQRSFLTPI